MHHWNHDSDRLNHNSDKNLNTDKDLNTDKMDIEIVTKNLNSDMLNLNSDKKPQY